MPRRKPLSIKVLLKDGQEAKAFNTVKKAIHRERDKKLYCLPEQADNWNALANQVVGAKHT